MSNPTIYRIDLRPLDFFFFGGEHHFGEKEEANYFVRSNYYPQQSGILGMLRHQLLIQNDCIPVKGQEVKAKELIGEESYNILGNVGSYGAIRKITPLFVSLNGSLLFPEAMEYYHNTKGKPEELSQINISCSSGFTMVYPLDTSKLVVSAGNEYLGKYQIQELLVDRNGAQFNYTRINDTKPKAGRNRLPSNGVFIETWKPGIQKSLDKKKGDKDQGYYVQYSYTFPPEACFTFYAAIDRVRAKSFESGRIMLGGEKSAFHMKVEEYIGNGSPFDVSSEFYSGLYERPHSSFHKLVCLSDCIASEELKEKVVFMSNPMIEFRNSRSKVTDTVHYSNIAREYETGNSKYLQPVRSQKYQLLKRGTVLWIDDSRLTEVEVLLSSENHRTIGYNYFKTIHKTQN